MICVVPVSEEMTRICETSPPMLHIFAMGYVQCWDRGRKGRVAQRPVNPRKPSALAANPGARVAVVCHGGAINAWAGHVLGISDPFLPDVAYTDVSRFLAT